MANAFFLRHFRFLCFLQYVSLGVNNSNRFLFCSLSAVNHTNCYKKSVKVGFNLRSLVHGDRMCFTCSHLLVTRRYIVVNHKPDE